MHRYGRCLRIASITLGIAATALGLVLATARVANAHCDTMNGPVVRDAKVALERGKVDPVLKWVSEDREAEVRAAFRRALAVRKESPEAREVADMWFFETLVRLHRAGEGEPFTGIKPEGTPVEPAIALADGALERGDADAVVKTVTDEVATGIRTRFTRAAEARKHADESVKAGREYAEAYVQYVHFVESAHAMATGGVTSHGEAPAAPASEH